MENKNNNSIKDENDVVFSSDVRSGGTRIKFGHSDLAKNPQNDPDRIMQKIAEQMAARIQKDPSPEVLKAFETDLRKRIEENAEILSWDADYEEIVTRVRNLLRRRS